MKFAEACTKIDGSSPVSSGSHGIDRGARLRSLAVGTWRSFSNVDYHSTLSTKFGWAQRMAQYSPVVACAQRSAAQPGGPTPDEEFSWGFAAQPRLTQY